MVRMLRPRLEALEARDCPTVSVTLLSGGTLRIVGTNDWEQVNVIQDDALNTLTVSSYNMAKPGEVVTQVIDIQQFQSSAVKRITVDLKAGNDVFYYSLDAGTDLLYAKDLAVLTGTGDDSVSVSLANRVMYFDDPLPGPMEEGGSPSIMPGPAMNSHITKNLNFVLDTGAGNDNVSVDLGDVDAGARVNFVGRLGAGQDTLWLMDACRVAASGRVKVDVDGQLGNDSLFAMVYGEIAGQLDVNLKGGQGGDLLNVVNDGLITGTFAIRGNGGLGDDTLAVNANMRADSTGTVSAQLFGDAGSDHFTYDVGLAGQGAAVINSLLHGGLGLDDAHCSRKVPAYSIERMVWR